STGRKRRGKKRTAWCPSRVPLIVDEVSQESRRNRDPVAMVADTVDRPARITRSDRMEPDYVGRMNLCSAASRRSDDGRPHEPDVRTGLGSSAVSEKRMIRRAAMLTDSD